MEISKVVKLFNPCADSIHACRDFKNLSLRERTGIVALTILATIATLPFAGIGGMVVFRVMVNNCKQPTGSEPRNNQSEEEKPLLSQEDTPLLQEQNSSEPYVPPFDVQPKLEAQVQQEPQVQEERMVEEQLQQEPQVQEEPMIEEQPQQEPQAQEEERMVEEQPQPQPTVYSSVTIQNQGIKRRRSPTAATSMANKALMERNLRIWIKNNNTEELLNYLKTFKDKITEEKYKEVKDLINDDFRSETADEEILTSFQEFEQLEDVMDEEVDVQEEFVVHPLPQRPSMQSLLLDQIQGGKELKRTNFDAEQSRQQKIDAQRREEQEIAQRAFANNRMINLSNQRLIQ